MPMNAWLPSSTGAARELPRVLCLYNKGYCNALLGAGNLQRCQRITGLGGELLVHQREQPGQRIGYCQGTNPEKGSKRQLVLRGNRPANGGDASEAAFCGTFRDASLPAIQI